MQREEKRATLKYDKLIIDGKLHRELLPRYSKWAEHIQALVNN